MGYSRDCMRWSDEHDLGEISRESLSRCFKMPRTGVTVKGTMCYEATLFPICDESYLEEDKIGHYSVNNGRLVFVYRDGYTYVTTGYWLEKELIDAGYTQRGFYVPFSNGERILDSRLADEWEEISARNKK